MASCSWFQKASRLPIAVSANGRVNERTAVGRVPVHDADVPGDCLGLVRPAMP